jgi:hypothetical protein
VSEWLLSNAKGASFQLYLLWRDDDDDDDARFVLDKQVELDFIMQVNWNNSPQIDIILIPSQPVFVLTA